MGPYLVLVRVDRDGFDSALILLETDDEAAAKAHYEDACRFMRDKTDTAHVRGKGVYLTTVRAEAKLS